MVLPQTAEYALRAVLHIARHECSMRVGEIATAVGVPHNYLSKTLHQLARAGVLASARGPAGGFRLAVAPAELTLEQVVSPFGSRSRRRCLLGGGVCGEMPECAAHTRWAPVGSQVREFFSATTVADLLSSTPSRDPEVMS